MRPGHCLRRKGSAYQFRFALPRALVLRFRRREIVVGLRTTSYPLALKRARVLRHNVDRLMDDLAHLTAKADAEQRIRAWIDASIAALEHDLGAHGSTYFSADEAAHMGPEQTVEISGLLADVTRFMVAERWRPAIAAHLAGRSPLDPGLADLSAAILAACGAAASPVAARVALRGLVTYLDERQALEQGAIAPVAAMNPAVAPQPARAAQTPVASETFFAHWPAFVGDKAASGEWGKDMAGNAEPAKKLFIGLVGDLPIEKIDRRAASEFRTGLFQLPRDYDKAAEWRAIPIKKLAGRLDDARAADPRRVIALLSKTTVNKHLTNLSTYWSWLQKHGRLDDTLKNPFVGLSTKRRRGRAARAERPEWSVDLQVKLFTSPVWRGCASLHRRSRPGPHVFRDALFWAPLAGRTMGVRSEEICGARVGDIRFADEIAYLAITDAKTDSSTRDVPLPALLLDLGFLEYRVCGRHPGERLFPELIEQGAAERASEALGNRFTYYRQKIKAYVEGMDFHALRHNVTTDLANMPGVKEVWIDEITGHESDARSSETSRYTKGIYLKHLKAALDRITLPVDLSHLAYTGERGSPAPGAQEQIQTFFELAEREVRKKAAHGKRPAA